MLLVKDVYDSKMMHSIIIDSDEDIEQAIRRFVERPDLRGLFAVDRSGKLNGVITRNDLLNFAKYRMKGGNLSIDQVRRFILASKVKDLIHPYSWRASVSLEDKLIKALNLMVELDLIVVPVIDKNRKIIGDLKLSQILMKISKSCRRYCRIQRAVFLRSCRMIV